LLEKGEGGLFVKGHYFNTLNNTGHMSVKRTKDMEYKNEDGMIFRGGGDFL